MKRDIHIAFCVNDAYVKYICVTIKSIVENHPGHSIHFHVLTDSITPKNEEKLRRISSPYTISIYEINDSRLEGLKVGRYTKYTWYRIFLPEILNDRVKRVLYLDADTLVASDISKLFEMDLTNMSIAAAPDDWNHVKDTSFFEKIEVQDPSRYFCAGVLLMNLEYWREHNLLEQLLSWAQKNNDKLLFPDQDALNYVCQASLILLPRSYDVTFNQFIDEYLLANNYAEVKESLLYPRIIHYCAMLPWFHEALHPHTYMWRKYNAMLSNDKVCIGFKDAYNKLLKMKIRLWHKLHPNHFHKLYEDAIHRVIRDM